MVLAPYQAKVETEHGLDIGRWMSPLKLFEYMSEGKAIVASDLPVVREVLKHGSNALLVPSNDVVAWGNAIDLLRQNPSLQQRLGQQALDDFRANHTWKRRAQLVLEGLDRLKD